MKRSYSSLPKAEQGMIAARLLSFVHNHRKASTPIWDCCRYYNDEAKYKCYLEMHYDLSNPNLASVQQFCEPIELGEADGYYTENGIKTIKI